jgi:hypothetical protein
MLAISVAFPMRQRRCQERFAFFYGKDANAPALSFGAIPNPDTLILRIDSSDAIRPDSFESRRTPLSCIFESHAFRL